MTDRLPIRFTRKAEAHLRAAAKWWAANRAAAPDMFAAEIHSALDLISRHPFAGATATNVNLPGVHRVLLRDTRYYLYYQVLPDPPVVQVLALWHTSRESGPKL